MKALATNSTQEAVLRIESETSIINKAQYFTFAFGTLYYILKYNSMVCGVRPSAIFALDIGSRQPGLAIRIRQAHELLNPEPLCLHLI